MQNRHLLGTYARHREILTPSPAKSKYKRVGVPAERIRSTTKCPFTHGPNGTFALSNLDLPPGGKKKNRCGMLTCWLALPIEETL